MGYGKCRIEFFRYVQQKMRNVIYSDVVLVANKWIRFHDQMHTHRCDPAKNVPFRFEVNGKPLTFNAYDPNLTA